MIPYDDLVAALSAWRARQGLPVSMMGGTPPTSAATAGSQFETGATSDPMSAVAASSGYGSGPMAATPGSGPTTSPPRTAPPRPAPTRASPPPLAPAEELDVEDAALLEEAHLESEADFAMSFGNDAETAVGSTPTPAPPPPTKAKSKSKSKRNRDDW